MSKEINPIFLDTSEKLTALAKRTTSIKLRCKKNGI